MRKKKVLVYGTSDSVNKFFADAASRDYEIVALLSEERLSIQEIIVALLSEKRLFIQGVEVFVLENLPNSIHNLVDAVIITDYAEKEPLINFFRNQRFEPRKLIFWNAKEGWDYFQIQEAGKNVFFLCGLEFHREQHFQKSFSRLQTNLKYKNMDPKRYPKILAESFKKRKGNTLDFDNLKTFTEKLQWLKIYDATPLKSLLTDKYLVRNWVAEKIGEQYLIPLLGVWDNFDDINFDNLPNQFVLKCNHGSGMNIIVRNKKTFNKQYARERINAWLAFDYAARPNLELHYTRIDRKIIAEKFMVNGNLPDLTDYKFYCFNGKLSHCKVVSDRSIDRRLDYFDNNWKHLDFERKDHPNSDHPEKIACPKNFELMKELATKLSKGFSLVRVDLYDIAGHVYFGEMTFTPSAGNFSYKSEGTDEYLGSLLTLPKSSTPPQLS